jgi:2,4-dienoyl-CoA reductase-like NADH-dependent reductase (Old Yellow Enzyme family)
MTAFPHLFSPLRMGHIELPNRIVHDPTHLSSTHADGEDSERDNAHRSASATSPITRTLPAAARASSSSAPQRQT